MQNVIMKHCEMCIPQTCRYTIGSVRPRHITAGEQSHLLGIDGDSRNKRRSMYCYFGFSEWPCVHCSNKCSYNCLMVSFHIGFWRNLALVNCPSRDLPTYLALQTRLCFSTLVYQATQLVPPTTQITWLLSSSNFTVRTVFPVTYIVSSCWAQYGQTSWRPSLAYGWCEKFR